ncbi:hypothetical protein ASD44_04655 [Mesorhizobium sp. Root554]|uniref:four-carbon acid sugar kinase family protein n=1 Tax=unclassified Mesorhizobium TaxID=325217 RepID=UPI0006F26D81|nr:MULTISPECIES: four-carbon acid sugar kinase family protein [unclassified Mesorhizobium]KQZ13443.1 hypothetical protein ASD27_04660 [Mesorhizobium sp. Root1471]KQZ35955.1 hypothetical protein ASD44_04655 [Mesorhizobium sp. Root554]
MTLKLAIVADDLTGALDTSAPLVAAGLTVAVAMTPEAVNRAVAGGPDVLAVNTASRTLPAEEAAACVAQAAAGFTPFLPKIVLKKIDSRLKGNIGAETAALAECTGRTSILVAAAVPDQGRIVKDGAVAGRGVDAPLAIRPLFAALGLAVEVADAKSDADLDRIVAQQRDWQDTLAVGARGIGLALARSLATGKAAPDEPLRSTQATLFAFGSRDPITERQIARLAEDRSSLVLCDAPAGRFKAASNYRLPLAVHCTGDMDTEPALVAARFGSAIAAAVKLLQPATLVMGGGDTALAILSALGADVLFPRGEAAPGLPWFEIAMPNGKKLRCVVKSGGFGTIDVLSELLREPVSERAEC